MQVYSFNYTGTEFSLSMQAAPKTKNSMSPHVYLDVYLDVYLEVRVFTLCNFASVNWHTAYQIPRTKYQVQVPLPLYTLLPLLLLTQQQQQKCNTATIQVLATTAQLRTVTSHKLPSLSPIGEDNKSYNHMQMPALTY